jgi:predicted Zn-dependent protease
MREIIESEGASPAMWRVVMVRLLSALVVALAFACLPLTPAQAQQATCSRPASDAEALYIISNQPPIGFREAQAYWWSRTDLTIGIQAAPGVDPDYYAAVERAIRTWQTTIDECLGGAVTLTYVPIEPGTRAQTDIVVHLVEGAGGNAFAGFAECSAAGCNNVIVSTTSPPGQPGDDGVAEYELWAVEGIALHEIGHALGLGHATNLLESTDLMGYGWANSSFGRTPPISQCDVDALAYVWAWALEGTEPARPEAVTYDCSQA